MLSKLTAADLSPSGFRYMRSAEAEVAGVPCLLLRIGFVGETGWEVHFPAEYGEYLWDAFMEAGAEFGDRSLRTGGATGAALGKGAHYCRPRHRRRFQPIGRRFRVGGPFRQRRLHRPRRTGRCPRAWRQPETRGVHHGGRRRAPRRSSGGQPRPAGGRVTSARLSPTLGKGFGLAWVPPDLAREGVSIEVVAGGRRLPATVTLEAVYDPGGERLRS